MLKRHHITPEGTYKVLALVHQGLGQPAAARPLLERALASDEATYRARPSQGRHPPV